MRELSLLEARVLGVLVEKAHTVPDSYPLSLNALVAGCNQKTARDPVINATDAEVQGAVDALKSLHLAADNQATWNALEALLEGDQAEGRCQQEFLHDDFLGKKYPRAAVGPLHDLHLRRGQHRVVVHARQPVGQRQFGVRVRHSTPAAFRHMTPATGLSQ